jgi:hypothetical protein
MNNIDGLSDEQVGDALVAVLYEEGDAVAEMCPRTRDDLKVLATDERLRGIIEGNTTHDGELPIPTDAAA